MRDTAPEYLHLVVESNIDRKIMWHYWNDGKMPMSQM